ncbi:helix-turn-helix transcriptional regulator [Microbacterium sp. NPDC056052]|uniref:helix-turn-helix transcriptional regulator n=1 Tax=Microbacterium sp. NPDC056052 TaxID=3345695 RepID=UPI0035DF2BEB
MTANTRPDPVGLERLLSIDELSAYLGVPKQTIYNWRTKTPAYGPQPIKVGRVLRYPETSVQLFVDALKG